MVSVSWFGVRFSVMFRFMFVYYTFSSVWVATFWEIAARSVNNLFSLYFVYLKYLFISRFCFMSGICFLIVPVPVHCFSITVKQEHIMNKTDSTTKVIEKRTGTGEIKSQIKVACVSR